ncbi:MAG: tRNA (adenosine(37)-N6)-dimethylallyltransferase MiaA [Aestuariivita sp.]|nr:tRNA (adenosine(37)-N6)-dimethylallyltransferase MiaA [Aestuariivita sp.]MCY4201139.1 tRNA (adenosine(37)-N6)-dimethylallyltransferase MiaA [Aestuariivita sp.]MCY4287804.1 tRNA (adenosine(37)-N6)-dimethylallyltransferase MiaA [Aestuariivita sp.]MCY4345970.1 tRNA (adenosine(37)-N6)-dimethylallyltransferase MiaA [Aestuariivita sp.]
MQLPIDQSNKPILIAGPTACGKSELAMAIADQHGGVIVNADASQVYDCWRVLTARPTGADTLKVPHYLYGHISWKDRYSVGRWLQDLKPLLQGSERLIIIGGTGLYFQALTMGLADIPPVPEEVRLRANQRSLAELCIDLDPVTRNQLDTANRARVQRAWEVMTSTGRSIIEWQETTPQPLLPISAAIAIRVDLPRASINQRISDRVDRMLAGGVLGEVATMVPHYDTTLPAFKAIGMKELTACVIGKEAIEIAREKLLIATRQFAKRQQTWLSARMRDWDSVDLDADNTLGNWR